MFLSQREIDEAARAVVARSNEERTTTMATTAEEKTMKEACGVELAPAFCPECGKPAAGTLEVVQATARIAVLEDGTLVYTGTTDVAWDSQRSEEDEAGMVTVNCEEWHGWKARLGERELLGTVPEREVRGAGPLVPRSGGNYPSRIVLSFAADPEAFHPWAVHMQVVPDDGRDPYLVRGDYLATKAEADAVLARRVRMGF